MMHWCVLHTHTQCTTANANEYCEYSIFGRNVEFKSWHRMLNANNHTINVWMRQISQANGKHLKCGRCVFTTNWKCLKLVSQSVNLFMTVCFVWTSHANRITCMRNIILKSLNTIYSHFWFAVMKIQRHLCRPFNRLYSNSMSLMDSHVDAS